MTYGNINKDFILTLIIFHVWVCYVSFGYVLISDPFVLLYVHIDYKDILLLHV